MAGGFGVNIKESEGLVVFVDFITGDFAVYDFGKYATHFCSIS